MYLISKSQCRCDVLRFVVIICFSMWPINVFDVVFTNLIKGKLALNSLHFPNTTINAIIAHFAKYQHCLSALSLQVYPFEIPRIH